MCLCAQAFDVCQLNFYLLRKFSCRVNAWRENDGAGGTWWTKPIDHPISSPINHPPPFTFLYPSYIHILICCSSAYHTVLSTMVTLHSATLIYTQYHSIIVPYGRETTRVEKIHTHSCLDRVPLFAFFFNWSMFNFVEYILLLPAI